MLYGDALVDGPSSQAIVHMEQCFALYDRDATEHPRFSTAATTGRLLPMYRG